MFARNPKMTKKKICSTVFFSGYVDSWFNITTKALFKSFFLDVFLLYINFLITLTTFFVKMDILSQRPDTLKQLDFLTKIFLQTFLCTRRLQFWQNWQKFFCQNLDFCSETENAPAITLPSKKTPKTFLWTRRLQFRQTCQKFYAKSPIFLLKDQKARANRLPSTKCPELVRRDTLNVVLTALDSFWQYFFLLKVQDFSAQSRKIWKKNNCDLKVFP